MRGLGFRGQGLGFRVVRDELAGNQGSSVRGLGFRVQGLGFRVMRDELLDRESGFKRERLWV